MILGFMFRPLFPQLWRGVSAILELVNLPTLPSLFNAALLFILAAAVRQRKRISIYLIIFILELAPVLLATYTVFALLLGERPAAGDRTQWLNNEIHGTGRDIATGVVGLIVIVLLIITRKAFPARLERGAWWRAGAVLVGGIAASTLVAYLLSYPFPGHLRTPGERIAWSFFTALGLGPRDYPVPLPHMGSRGVTFLVGVISGLALLAAIVIFSRSARLAKQFTDAEELHIRSLLLEYGENDSLGYFATRRDKSMAFAEDGRAAISYRVVGGVSLASGDPVGDPGSWTQALRAWQSEARNFGWTLAAISASPEGAQAYAKAGLRPIAMGDEAILETANFHLRSPNLRAVRAAALRTERSGYYVQVHRGGDIPAAELAELDRAASAWRHGRNERGFSMALGRFGDPTDARSVVVVARNERGEAMGLLCFVPWGPSGLSLDLMRRNPEAVSGVTELMVSSLMRTAADLGIQRVSLNFAMFRRAFEAGATVGAGPVQRFKHRALVVASRWWQLESLYRSNEKYHPTWQPRLMCIDRGASLSMVVIAAGQAEGYIPAPLVRLTNPSSRATDSERLEGDTFTAAVHLQETAASVARLTPRCDRTEQERVRIHRLDELKTAGIEPYPASVPRTHSVAEVRSAFAKLEVGDAPKSVVSITGRVLRQRNHGGIAFADIREGVTNIQVMLRVDNMPRLDGAPATKVWSRLVDLGDLVSVTGQVCMTRSGEFTVDVSSWCLAAKSLKPMPDKRHGIIDPELKQRLRHVDLATSTESLKVLLARSTVLRALRNHLDGRGFIEVETPMLQRIHGGANARPFMTHINAYDADLYLRIAPELSLKKLCVGGMPRIFELGRSFRNEGADSSHNPEFTSLEVYQAYADYDVMRALTQDLVVKAAVAVHGRPAIRRPDGTWWDISGDWPVVQIHEAVSLAVDTEVTPDTDPSTLLAIAARHGVAIHDTNALAGLTTGEIVLEIYDELVEPSTMAPTFYTDFPLETSPLTRTHKRDARLSERWDLVAFGVELGTAYSELTDPLDQRDRLTSQSVKAAAGDPEAMEVDEDFLAALEFGMPPTGGLGLGVDRIVMLLMGASIRQTLAFPFVRPAGR